MRVGIVGSRRRSDRESVDRLVDSLSRTDIVVSGGCVGVDTWAIQAADRRAMSHAEHLPLLLPGMGYGERVAAYYARNKRLAEDCDVLYAFVAPDRKGGTENTVGHAKAAGVKTIIMAVVEEIDETEPLPARQPRVYNKRGAVPGDAVYVGRPTKWGNPYSHIPDTAASKLVHSRSEAVRLYGKWLARNHLLAVQARQELAGKDLVCWCAPLSCHADALLLVANAAAPAEVDET